MGKWDNFVIWKTDSGKPSRDEGFPRGSVLRDHADPTADIAIANITREEKRKRLAAEAAEASRINRKMQPRKQSSQMTHRQQYTKRNRKG